MRAFSPFTQRALHPVEAAVVYPAAERRLDLVEPTLTDDDQPIPVPSDLVLPVPAGPDLVWQADEVRAVWDEEGLEPVRIKGAAIIDPLPANQPFAFEAQRPALVARGLSEAENELDAFVRAGQRVVVAFPHPGEALRQQNLLRRVERTAARRRRTAAAGARAPLRRHACAPRVRLAGSRAHPSARHAGLPQAAAEGASGRRACPAVLRRPAHRRLRRPRGPRRRQAPRLRDEGGRRASRATTSSSASAATTGCTSRTSSSARSRATSALDGSGPALSKLGGKAWDNLKNRARASVRELAGELLALYAQRQQAARRRVRPAARVPRAARGRVSLPRDARPAGGDRGRQGGPRGAAADGPARLRRRRLRQDRGCDSRGVRGRRQRQADADARADDDPRRAALAHVPRALPRLPGARRDGVALPAAARGQAGPRRLSGREGGRPDRDAPSAQPRRHPEGARARDPRRGAALRRRAEGAAALVAARGRRADPERDADPAHAAHVARRVCATSRSSRRRPRDGARSERPSASTTRRRSSSPSSARSSVAGRRSTCTTASRRSKRRWRSCSSSRRTCASSSRTARCASASSRRRCTRSCAETRTCSSRRRSSSRASTSRRPTR